MSENRYLSLQEMWDNHECPGANGIYYANGDSVVLDVQIPERDEDEYSIGIVKEVTLSDVEAVPGFFSAFVNPLAVFEDSLSDVRIFGGEGGYGSEGFIAVLNLSDKKLRWLAFFNDSNPFISVSLEGDTVVGVTNLDYVWRIPLYEPRSIVVEPVKHGGFRELDTDDK